MAAGSATGRAPYKSKQREVVDPAIMLNFIGVQPHPIPVLQWPGTSNALVESLGMPRRFPEITSSCAVRLTANIDWLSDTMLSSLVRLVIRPLDLRRCHPPTILLLISLWYSAPISQSPASIFRSTEEISGVRARHFRYANAGFTKSTQPQMKGFAVMCPLTPNTPHLISGFLFITHSFEVGFLQILSCGNALVVSLARLCENLATKLPPA